MKKKILIGISVLTLSCSEDEQVSESSSFNQFLNQKLEIVKEELYFENKLSSIQTEFHCVENEFIQFNSDKSINLGHYERIDNECVRNTENDNLTSTYMIEGDKIKLTSSNESGQSASSTHGFEIRNDTLVLITFDDPYTDYGFYVKK